MKFVNENLKKTFAGIRIFNDPGELTCS